MVDPNPFDDVDRAIGEIIVKQLETVKVLDGLEADLNTWECDFLQSVLDQLEKQRRSLTQKQIEVVRRLCEQYDVECDL
jgi:hypothetical protein